MFPVFLMSKQASHNKDVFKTVGQVVMYNNYQFYYVEEKFIISEENENLKDFSI